MTPFRRHSISRNSTVLSSFERLKSSLSTGTAGAGLFVAGTGDVDISNATVTKNVMGSQSSNGVNQGGGMGFWTSGSVNLSNDTVSDNSITTGTLGTYADADGAGIFETGAKQMLITNTTVTGKTATPPALAKSMPAPGLLPAFPHPAAFSCLT
jgi:hypothetical protein